MSKSRKFIYLVVAITILIIIAIIGFFIINKKIFQDTNISIADYKYFVLYSENDKINKIEIDIDTSLLKENIVIEYKNIGNISDFSINSWKIKKIMLNLYR